VNGKRVRARFWIETTLASASAALGILTIIRRDWIELVLGFDPDRHNGAAEWIVVAVLLAVALVSGRLARVEYAKERRLATQAR
jgi:hypothetical protein